MLEEILAGLAGGAQGGVQGLGLIQDNRQQQAQQKLRERQATLQEQEARRQAVKQAWDTMQEGHSFEDATQAQQFVDLGYGVIKGPDGRPMKPKSIQTQASELGLKNAQGDYDFEQKQRDVLNQSLEPGWMERPMAERVALGGFAQGKPAVLSPQENLQYDPQYRASQADNSTALQVARIGADQRRTNDYLDYTVALNKAKYEEDKAVKGENVKLASEAYDQAVELTPYGDPATIIAKANELYAGKKSMLGQIGQPQAGVPVLGGKYTRIQ